MGYLKVLTSLKFYFQVASYCTTGGIHYLAILRYSIGSPCIGG